MKQIDYAERCDEVANRLGLVLADSDVGEGFTFYDDSGLQQRVGDYLLTKLETIFTRHDSELDEAYDSLEDGPWDDGDGIGGWDDDDDEYDRDDPYNNSYRDW